MLTLPNYQIGTQIYESANSLVYRGVRKKDNQPVILKVLKEDYPTPEELTHYRQEYEITHDLDSTGIIKVYDIEKYQNTLVIILEDFGGESLKQLMADRPLAVKEFLPLAIQIADSLGNIHAANIIHKDINPSNIVVNIDTNQLKIFDFGIASRLPRENPTLKNPEQLEGTLAYLSPEQTGRINRSMDYRTDLYSLGVTFYELLTGQLPFDSTDAMELVHCHIAKTPTPVCDVNLDVPPIISDIVLKLLAKNAEDRYQSAFGIKADLEKVQKNLTGFSFDLAQNDFSGKLQIPQKLYGREREVESLLQAFDRIIRGAREMMLVAGYSGVGKTALVHEIHKPMTEKRGYFAAGKFDQFQKNIPYSAITQAFNEFCRYLLLENAETLADWQTKILDAVGNNGQIIIDVIPDLELVIGKQPTVAKVGPTEAQNRFQMFFLNFAKVLCDKDHPFILFIDDLQWVDSGSLVLLKSIMVDEEIRYLLIIGAYRDNEVDSTHPFVMAVSELEKANATINTIELVNLQSTDINHLLQNSLISEAVQTQPLTDLVYQKTQGNAFFTHQFLQTLYFEALLQFDFEQHQWQWDVEKIAAQNLTDNVVDLMANKIDKLPSSTSAALQLAACIGNQFDLPILAIIYEQDQPDTLEVLRPAIAEGLIQPLDENYKHFESFEKSQFKFLHDRVQQAAYALIAEANKQPLHLKIGRLILGSMSSAELEENIFEVVDHLNQGQALIGDDFEKARLAELNLTATRKAKLSSAYSAALKYVTAGMMYLPNNCWETNYDQTLSYYLEKGEIEYLNAGWDDSIATLDAAFKRVNNLLDRCKINEYKATLYRMKNDLRMSLDIAVQALSELGIELKNFPEAEDVTADIERLKLMTAGMDIDRLFELPELEEPLKLATMALLRECFAPAYFLGSQLISIIGVRMTEITIKYGNSPHSAVGYIFYSAITLAVNLNDYDNAYQFGKLALRLNDERYNEKVHEALILDMWGTFVCHHKEPLSNASEHLLKGYYSGVETGSYQWSGYCAMIHLFMCFWGLHTLPQVLEKVDKIVPGLQKIDPHMIQLQYYYAIKATALNLIEPVEDRSVLSESAWPEANKILKISREQDDIVTLFIDTLCKLSLANWYRDYKKAAEYAELGDKYAVGVQGVFINPVFHFHQSLAYAAAYEYVEASKQVQYLEKLQSNLFKFELWANHSQGTYLHQALLIKAELARIKGNDLEAMDLYDRAIASAEENYFTQNEALAYELAAEFYLGRGMEKIAQTYMKEAHYRYQQWGALAKVEDLETRYPQWLAQTNYRQTNSTISAARMAEASTKSGSQWLDLNSIMKAAQTLSGEIVLSRLLKKMMQIVIENAGAETGFLLLNQHDNWFIEAQGHNNSDEINVLQSHPIENQPIAKTIIYYVERTQENVVLNHATQEGQFTRDPYIKKQRPKSILCLPLVNQGQLTGILYLENNLTTGAFTPERVQVLQVISSQLAISVENALLYRTLEQKVKERTAQLAEANEEITALNEQLKSDNLRMSAELEVSKQLQQMLLPKNEELEAVDGLDIAGFMEPADEVGGDYYDVLQYNGRILFGIGDVTGHGLESGALAIMVQSAVRALLANNETDPVKFFSALNQMVYHNVQRMNADKNLTLALIDYKENQLYLSGQHEEMIVVRNGELELIDTMDLGFLVGLDEDIAKFVHQATVPLNAGDVVVLYTDGITEAFNMKKKEYGLERLCEIIQQNWQQTAHEIQQAVIADVRQFIGEQKVFDDITLLVLKQK